MRNSTHTHMYHLSDFIQDIWGQSTTDDVELLCSPTDAELTLLTNRMQDTLACYSFTLVTQGWLTILYNGRELTFHENDLYIYTPGFAISIIATSDDYHGYCLIAAESMTFETPIIRNMIRAAYFPIVEMSEPKLTLSSKNAGRLCRQMQNIIDYQQADHLFRTETLRLLYSVFLLDLMDIQEHTTKSHHLSERTENLFIAFIRLLPQHFVEHHDIGFYAGRLNITPIYLSRIVRRTTGRTVVDYINQMLMMEATWLLLTTELSIAQIADRLHFADAASFSKFFTRLKGQSPRVFRSRV